MPRTRRSPTVLSACLPAFLVAALPGPLQAACTAVVTVPLTVTGNQIFLPVTLNGHAAQMLLDTGAGITAVSTAIANADNIPHDFDHHATLGGVAGSNNVLLIAQLDTLGLGALTLHHQAFPIIDLPQSAPDGAPAGGLLGADILHHFDVDLDIAGGKLTLYETSCADRSPPWRNPVQPSDIQIDANNHVVLPFHIDGIAMNGLLDTGAGHTSVTARAALRSGLNQDDLDADPRISGVGVNNAAWQGHLHRFEKIEIGDTTITGLPAAVIDSQNIFAYDALAGQDSLLGMDVLKTARLWISYRAHQLTWQRP